MQQQQPPPQPATPPPATTPSQPAQSQPAQPGGSPAAPQQSPAQPQFNPQQVTPVVQIDAPRRSEEVGVEDVLIGSIAMIAVLIAAALVVGLITGGIFIAIQRWRDKNDPDSTQPTATRLNLS